MNIETKVILDRLDEIYRCGKKDDGTNTRMAYSFEDQKGRDLYISYAEQIGLKWRKDEAGNIILALKGSEPSLPSILMGSHLDTVPDGGRYDGALGCMAALGVLEAYVKAKKKPRHTLEAIVFTDEEGFRFGNGLFGSSAFCGVETGIHDDDEDIFGENRKAVMANAGINTAKIKNAVRKKESVRCFIELHIEQGAVLYRQAVPIGIVSSISGVRRYSISVKGEANHAGSTVMADRKDALTAASEFIYLVPDAVKKVGNEFTVATVGTLKVLPGSVNVIPGECIFSLEIRDRSDDVITKTEVSLRVLLDDICRKHNVSFKFENQSSHPPAPMSSWVMNKIESAVKEVGCDYRIFPSGAFHDSLIMSSAFPTGMIFVPSIKGISHSPFEDTDAEDIKKGCEVLLKAIEHIDSETDL